jgi:hypothetical protein
VRGAVGQLQRIRSGNLSPGWHHCIQVSNTIFFFTALGFGSTLKA